MAFDPLPAFAAWRFEGIVDGFEVLYVRGRTLQGHSVAVEDGQPHAVRYAIEVDERWRTRSARISADVLDGPHETHIETDGEGRWTIDGTPAPHLDGLLDIDLEASVCTNLLPLHRLATPVGEPVRAEAAWVRALDLSVSRLEQTYTRLDDTVLGYVAGEFTAQLAYDTSGVIVDYPGIARRVA